MNTNDQDEGNASADPAAWRSVASMAADGEASSQEFDALLKQLRQDGPSRLEVLSAWHSYQLIGDVMRSDDLAGRGRDNAFMHSFRERLAQEPVVIAPVPAASEVASGLAGGASGGTRSASAVRSRPRLVAGVAAVAVAGVLAAFLGLGDGSGVLPQGQVLVEAPTAREAVTLVQAPGGAPVAGSVPQPDTLQLVVTPSGQMLRDAALDQYLQAHSQFGGSSALQLPAGFMRGATAPSPSSR